MASLPKPVAIAPVPRRVSVPQDVIEDILSKLGPSALGIYVYLARRANRDGEAWPSFDTIARDCSVQRRWAIKVVQTLVAAGFIERVAQQDKRGGHASNLYRLPHQIALFAPSEQHSGVPSEPPSEQPSGVPSTEVQNKAQNEERRKTLVPEGFAAFWSAYPHVNQRSVKGEALKVWQAKGLEPIADRILTVLERCERNPDWQKEGGQFIPGAQRWLRTEPWLEDDDQPQAPAAKPRGTIVHGDFRPGTPLAFDWEPSEAKVISGAAFCNVPTAFVRSTLIPLFVTQAASRTSRDWDEAFLNFVRGQSWKKEVGL
jgi:hypothetical protein